MITPSFKQIAGTFCHPHALAQTTHYDGLIAELL